MDTNRRPLDQVKDVLEYRWHEAFGRLLEIAQFQMENPAHKESEALLAMLFVSLDRFDTDVFHRQAYEDTSAALIRHVAAVYESVAGGSMSQEQQETTFLSMLELFRLGPSDTAGRATLARRFLMSPKEIRTKSTPRDYTGPLSKAKTRIGQLRRELFPSARLRHEEIGPPNAVGFGAMHDRYEQMMERGLFPEEREHRSGLGRDARREFGRPLRDPGRASERRIRRALLEAVWDQRREIQGT